MLENANAAIVVVADENKSDVWVEDASIVMSFMHLTADAIGLGSCWIQGRNRMSDDTIPTEHYIQELLTIPSNYRLEAILSLGMPSTHPAPKDLTKLPTEKVHYEKF
ncbi:MAG: nitroreductase family protein [Erysipelotrichaceae bacterium]|nr:nitroreductase family protein [Erysipelotrichaceae bacterium]